MSSMRLPNGKNQQVSLKLPAEIVEALHAIADRESRSLSGQVLHYVKRCLREDADDAGK